MTETIDGPDSDIVTDTRAQRASEALVAQLMKVIDEGVGPLGGARDYAESRQKTAGSVDGAIQRIVRESTVGAGGVGFATSVGGIVTTVAALPVNVSVQAVINARMVAAIAHLRGWDIQDEAVRAAILITLAGSTPNAALRGFGIKVGQGVATTAIKRIPIDVIRAINKKFGFMLLAKYGTKRSAVALVRFVPIAGGVVGGTFDAAFARTVAAIAKKSFPPVDDAPTVAADSADTPSSPPTPTDPDSPQPSAPVDL
ncbi:EcsC family protein [Mumia flava]|uniref:EcsC family protein n=1 Tax=Mumia flava TaxID=1348852 RepID=A0A2M9B761_9ACTN|nr:EcsC family protein [Mumia flava]PJJ53762.1 EcsC family protein [Mumia flava]